MPGAVPMLLQGYSSFLLPALKLHVKGRVRGGLAITVSVKLDVVAEVQK